MKIEEIQMGQSICCNENITICALQLESPFPTHLQVSEAMGNKILTWKPKGLRENKEKIITILENLKKHTGERKIDILVLPEYYCDITYMEEIKKYSCDNNIIIICNYYIPDTRHNISSIVLPDNTEYKQYKLYSSEYDKEFLSEIDESNQVIYKFYWMHDRGKSFFQVLPCYDFLTLSLEYSDYDTPGIIIVPMASSEINEFEGLASYIIRKGKKCDINKAIVLTNSVTNRKLVTKKKQFRGFCGSTQIVAQSKIRIKLSRFQESGLIALINPSNAMSRMTPIDRENSVVYSELSFNIDEKGDISSVISENNRNVSINPNILKCLNLHKYYVFYKVEQYNKVKLALEKTTMGCSGIFGTQDLLLKSYEEQYDFLELRLSHQLGRKRENLTYSSHYMIEEVYKFRGEVLCSDTGSFEHNQTPGLADFLSKNKHAVRNILIGNTTDIECKENLIKKGVLLDGPGNSDITPYDRNEGKEEYLIFILFEEKDLEVLSKNIQKFKSHILPSLIADPRIRTIEFSGSNVGGPNRSGCCICHLVGYLDDIREVVLNDLHYNMSQHEIEYGTRLVPIAENLSKSKYDAIIETSINDYDTRETVLELLHYMKDYPDVFIIKKLPQNILNDLCKIFVEVKSWTIDVDGINGAHNKRRLLHNIDEFIYGFSYEFVMHGSKTYDADIFPDFTLKFVNQLYKFLEKILYNCIIDKATQVGKDVFLELVNSDKCRDKKEGPLNYSFSQTTLGKTTKLISCWNNKFAKEYGLIMDETFHDHCNRLQGFTNFRNGISHTDVGDPKKINPLVLNDVYKAITFTRHYYSAAISPPA